MNVSKFRSFQGWMGGLAMKKKMILVMFILMMTLTGCVRHDSRDKRAYAVHIIYNNELFSNPRYVTEGNTLGDTLGIPRKNHHVFLYWETMDGQRFYPEDTIHDNYFFYEVFEPIQYSMVFETNGGEPIKPKLINEGTAYFPPTPIRPDYDFIGWFVDPEFNIPYFEFNIVVSDITLYAKWTLTSYTVYYQLSESQWFRFTAYPGDDFPTISMSKYDDFDYWYETNPMVPFVFPSDMPKRNITLYAKYK